MNLLYSEFKRKFALSMYKNKGIPMGEMSFLKDFVNDTRGDPYPLIEKSKGCTETVADGRYRLSGGAAERVFCQLFPFATYEVTAERISGEVGFVFRLPSAAAILTLVFEGGDRYVSYRCENHAEKIPLPEDVEEASPFLVALRPGFFDLYTRKNGAARFLFSVKEPLFGESNRYRTFRDANVSLYARGEIEVKSVTATLDNGVSIADFRPIRYEDGTVITEGGKVYFTASIRAHADNYQAIFSWVPGTAQLEMTGALFFDCGDGFWRGYVASVLLYHRQAKKWYVWTSSFAHAHILAYGEFEGDPRFGINVADVRLMEESRGDDITEFAGFFRDEDPDLVYDAKTDRWLLAICRIDKTTDKYVYVFFASKDPFHGFRYIGRGAEGASETGGVFIRLEDELFFACGNAFDRRSEYRIYSKDGMREAKFRYPDGGFRGWGCVIPVTQGSRRRLFWLTFDRHNGSDYNWSYGNFYCFEAEE